MRFHKINVKFLQLLIFKFVANFTSFSKMKMVISRSYQRPRDLEVWQTHR